MTELRFEVDCSNCMGACCRANVIQTLTADEAEFLGACGTQLGVLVDARARGSIADYTGNDETELARQSFADDLPKDHGAYLMQSDCGNLQIDPGTGVGSCGAYDDPRRPRSCWKFKEDSIGCNNMRRSLFLPANSIPTELELTSQSNLS